MLFVVFSTPSCFCLFVLVLVCMSVVFVVLTCCRLASSLLVAVSLRQVVNVCFSLSSCDPLGFVNRVCVVVLTCCHLAFWSYWWLCRLPNVCGCVSVC